jgi:hypothetical protein
VVCDDDKVKACFVGGMGDFVYGGGAVGIGAVDVNVSRYLKQVITTLNSLLCIPVFCRFEPYSCMWGEKKMAWCVWGYC